METSVSSTVPNVDCRVVRGEECFLVTDVVDRNLRGGGGGLGAARHVGKGSGTDIEVVGTAYAGSPFRSAEAGQPRKRHTRKLVAPRQPRGHTTDASATCYV